jgi:hypothetical protein
MNYLRRGLQKTVHSIKKRKLLFIFLILLQIGLLVLLYLVSIPSLLQILKDTQGVIQPLEQANYDSQQIEQGQPFTPDAGAIYKSYQSMVRNVMIIAAWMLVLLLLVNGSIWLLSHWLLQEKKNWKNYLKEVPLFYLKACAAALLLFVPFTIGSYYALIYYIRLSDSFSQVLFMIKLLLGVKVLLYYFLLVALAAALTPSWKEFAKKVFTLSISKAGKTFLLFLINGAILGFFFAVLYGAVEYAVTMNADSLTIVIGLLALGLLLMVTMVLTRLFWIATVQEIEKE